jgi:hypothetical protein
MLKHRSMPQPVADMNFKEWNQASMTYMPVLASVLKMLSQ